MFKNQLFIFILLVFQDCLAQSDLPNLPVDEIYEYDYSRFVEEQLLGKVKEVKKIVVPVKKRGANGINLLEYYEISKNKHFFLDKKGNLRQSISYKRDTIVYICNYKKKKIINRISFDPCCLGNGMEKFFYKKSNLIKYAIYDEKDSLLLVEKGIYDRKNRLIASSIDGVSYKIVEYPTHDSFFVANYFYKNRDTILTEAYSKKYLDGDKKTKSYTYQIKQNKIGDYKNVRLYVGYNRNKIFTKNFYDLDKGVFEFIHGSTVMTNREKKEYEITSYSSARDSTSFFYNEEGVLKKAIRYDIFSNKNDTITISEYDENGNIILVDSENRKKGQWTYVYDSHNNWIESIYLIDNVVVENAKRIIKYYKD